MLIDKEDANKILKSVIKIMEEIFRGTMKRFIGSEVPTHRAGYGGKKGNIPITTLKRT